MVNVWEVLVAAVVGYVVGALWYSPVLFGKLWMRLSGVTMGDMEKAKQKGMAKSYVIMFIGILIMSYVLAQVLEVFGAASAWMGIQIAFWLWLGFIATVMVGMVLWENKSWNLYILNVAHYLVVLLVMGAILAVWP